jgi:hypothetical protein
LTGLILLVLVAGAAAAAWWIRRLKRRIADLGTLLGLAGGMIGHKDDQPEALLAVFPDTSDWDFVEQGGDMHTGRFGGRGQCPCRRGYSLATRSIVLPLNAWTPAVRAALAARCAANPPPVAAPDWKCPDPCQHVLTHVWHGWSVLRNRKAGVFVFHCHTFGQYHCKLPTDPDFDKPPRTSPPDQDEWPDEMLVADAEFVSTHVES